MPDGKIIQPTYKTARLDFCTLPVGKTRNHRRVSILGCDWNDEADWTNVKRVSLGPIVSSTMLGIITQQYDAGAVVLIFRRNWALHGRCL